MEAANKLNAEGIEQTNDKTDITADVVRRRWRTIMQQVKVSHGTEAARFTEFQRDCMHLQVYNDARNKSGNGRPDVPAGK